MSTGEHKHAIKLTTWTNYSYTLQTSLQRHPPRAEQTEHIGSNHRQKILLQGGTFQIFRPRAGAFSSFKGRNQFQSFIVKFTLSHHHCFFISPFFRFFSPRVFFNLLLLWLLIFDNTLTEVPWRHSTCSVTWWQYKKHQSYFTTTNAHCLSTPWQRPFVMRQTLQFLLLFLLSPSPLFKSALDYLLSFLSQSKSRTLSFTHLPNRYKALQFLFVFLTILLYSGKRARKHQIALQLD